MGFWALWKWFSPWSKRNYPNMIYWYKEYVLKTPEQREFERKARERSAKKTLAALGIINEILGKKCRYYGDYY